MSRINTNISSLQAITRLNKNQGDLATRLQRLSSGLRINSGKDAPAGLIASESLRSEIAGIHQAIDNSQRAGNVINTAEGALSEVSSLMLEVQTLTNQAANTGALSPDEIKANQLQVDSILNTINRISQATAFQGKKLLNGNFAYTTSGVTSTQFDNVHINTARIPDGGFANIVVQVTTSAQTGAIRMAHYSSTKGAIVTLTRTLAQEFGPFGITVNNIPPGSVMNTLMAQANKNVMPMSMEDLVKSIPVRRVGEADDIANACAWLVSDASSYVTGQTIGVNGGRVVT